MKPLEVVVLVWVGILFILMGVIFASPLICTAQTTISTALIQGIPAGIIALIIAGIGSGIAYNQYRVARAKLNLDLFAQRRPIFDYVLAALGEFTKSGEKFDPELLNELNRLTATASFLFGKEIPNYMQEIAAHATQLDAFQGLFARGGYYTAADVVAGANEHRLWLWNQHAICRAKFDPYLSFAEWR